tara:strand:+ start:1148 stop:1522 length:375 start_codon:yes stop_codon:yes gene_type:complete
MKSNELKKVLKPLIKQCIKEVIFEEGVLSGIISEVVKGVETTPVVREQKKATKQDDTKVKRKIKEQRKRMLDMVGKDAYNGVDIFKGVEPIRETNQHSPLSNISPGDPGVDISGLVNSNWSKLI